VVLFVLSAYFKEGTLSEREIFLARTVATEVTAFISAMIDFPLDSAQ